MSEEYKNTPEDEDIPDIEESSLIGTSDADQENEDAPVFGEKEDASSLSRPEETSEKPSTPVTEGKGTDMASIVAAAASEAISAALSAVHPQKDQTADLQLLSEQIAALKKEVGDLREELNTSKADLESIQKSTLYEKENDDSAANIINAFLLQLREAPKYLSEIHEERQKREVQSKEIAEQLERFQSISSNVDGMVQLYSDASNIIQLTQDANQPAAMVKIEKTSQGMLKKIKGFLGNKE